MEPSLDLRVSGGALWAGPGRFWPKGAVEITAGRVSYAGDASGAGVRPARHQLDAGGGLIMPGLVNAHCHGAMVLFRGMADDLPLDEWLQKEMFPAEAEYVTDEMVEVCCRLAAAEMLLSGTTCVGDSYFCMQGAVPAYIESGMRAVLAQGVIDFPAPGAPNPAKNLQVAREFVQTWQGVSPRITPGVFAHAPYTCSPETMNGALDLARSLEAPFFTHLAESKPELDVLRQRYGKGPVRHLRDIGVLEGLTACAHGVWLQDDELAELARAGVALVHCPESNMKLGSGAARVEDWLQAGIRAGLGTDGAASNNDLDMFGEMKSAAFLAKVSALDPAALPAEKVLEMATRGSARALGLERTGKLEPGYDGDLIVVDLHRPHHTPWYQAASALVYAGRGTDVRHVVVEGNRWCGTTGYSPWICPRSWQRCGNWPPRWPPDATRCNRFDVDAPRLDPGHSGPLPRPVQQPGGPRLKALAGLAGGLEHDSPGVQALDCVPDARQIHIQIG